MDDRIQELRRRVASDGDEVARLGLFTALIRSGVDERSASLDAFEIGPDWILVAQVTPKSKLHAYGHSHRVGESVRTRCSNWRADGTALNIPLGLVETTLWVERSTRTVCRACKRSIKNADNRYDPAIFQIIQAAAAWSAFRASFPTLACLRGDHATPSSNSSCAACGFGAPTRVVVTPGRRTFLCLICGELHRGDPTQADLSTCFATQQIRALD